MNGNKHESGSTVSPADTGASLLEQAIRFHRNNQLREAEAAYHEILRNQPEEPTALHMLGVLAYQAGNYEEAINLIDRARAHIPGDAGLLTNLGSALQASNRLDEAVAAFNAAIDIMPRFALAHNNLGNALRLQGKHEQSIAAFQQALSINDNADTQVNLAAAYQALGDMEKARHCYQRAVELDPGHKSAAHMLAAFNGQATEAAPNDHVARLFDEYAAKFDSHLVDTLGYSMPGLLRNQIDLLMGQDARFHNAIDLGCGTGLTGVAFHPVCDRLTGIDLSPRMIDKARDRGVYDELHTGNIVTFLSRAQQHYDLFICADVFPYIGDVQPLFSALSGRAEKGALFAFSTELHSGSGYALRPTGRYAHAQEYLRGSADNHGFSVMTMRTENLRKQKENWIQGDLVILQYGG